MTKLKKLSWKAVRCGEIYCAPACGRGCTVHMHELATSRAAVLAQTLGRGWKPKVSENLGWHWSAEHSNRAVAVHGDEHEGRYSYNAFVNAPGRLPGGIWTGQGRTPQAALREALANAEREVADKTEILRLLRKAIS